jgi:N-acyl-D-amino-acid deacylase
MTTAGFRSPSLVIRGGDVIDGTGRARFAADVLIADGVICALVPPGTGIAREVIAADGMIVCPGFIDSHSHDDQLVLTPTSPHPKLTQGVCTVVVGNCGISLAPLISKSPPAPLDLLGKDFFFYPSFGSYLKAIDRSRPAVNVVPLIGHTTLRAKHVADLDREASEAEISLMRNELIGALDDGAFGLSTGVYYPPARAATTAELHGVCLGLKGRSAVLAMHLRDEGDAIDAALREALDVGAASGANLILSHHKVVGSQNHGRTRQTLQVVEQASLSQAVCVDCYPYEASSTMLSPEKAARTGNVLITWSGPHPELSGRNLEQIAAEWKVDLFEAAKRLMPGGAIYFAMASEDVERVLLHPLTMVGSDGLPHDVRPHPRLWGTFPRMLGHYSRDKKLMSLERTIYKMTGLPAQRFGLQHRGVIAVGNAADLVVFDPADIRDGATYENPCAPALGIEAVLVNGQLAILRGDEMRSHAGRRLHPQKL